MEKILRDSKVTEMIPYNLSGKYLLFPVRHHSPVCSYQLVRTIREYQPEIILIEGPENANCLIPALVNEKTKLPSAIYYYYKDTKKLVSEDGNDYKCYYPFLYSSPEYNAMKQAVNMGIPAEFIDLPYCDILINTAEQKGLRKKAEKHSYADDTRLVQSRFYEKLCENTNVRSFEEFWEKYFEIAGIFLTPEKFVRQLHTYCTITRAETSDEEMKSDGTLAREAHMAGRITEAMEKYNRVLVVTGGFHSKGIYDLIESGKIKPPKLRKIPANQHGCYPMAYSYEASDALHGYASGMSFPAFYDSVTLSLLEKGTPENIYNDLTLDLLVKTAKETNKKDIPVSIADVTSAKTLMDGLSALRNSRQSGMYELFDAVTSTFIKGEKTVSSALPLDILRKLATGKAVGFIGDTEHIPPLITDFEEQAKKFSLKINDVTPNDVEVSLFTKQKDMDKSRFLHRMDFLDTGFAVMRKGPDLHTNKGRSRVREEWRYARSPEVDSSLIDHTTDGFTIEEACITVAVRKLRDEMRCEMSARVAVDCFLMGIPLQQSELDLIDEILTADGDFFSVGNGLRYFETLNSLQQLYSFSDSSSLGYIRQCFEKLITALPSMAGVQSDRADDVISILKTMYGIAGNILSDEMETFEETLTVMSQSAEKEPSVYGAVSGLLYAIDSERRAEAENAMRGYLMGTVEIKKQGAEFLKGLFSTARDIVLSDGSFLKMTDTLITEMDYDDFMEILPSMRLAFSYFTPSEIQDTAQSVAELHSVNKKDILNSRAVDENMFLFGESLDSEICRFLDLERE
ncbi:MAG: DUF5682 family protein [Ruminococcus flavefaciens]|nr:DUF5682 family protein [Ruminococcus flavefaciens]